MQYAADPVKNSPTPAKPAGVGNLVDKVSSYAGFIGAVMLFLSSLTICYEIVARFVFRQPTIWTSEVSVLLIATAVFTTVAFGLKEGSHVNVEIVSKYLPKSSNLLLDIINCFLIFIFAVFFVIEQTGSTMRSFDLMERSTMLYWPLWPVKTVVLVSFVILSLQAARMVVGKSAAT